MVLLRKSRLVFPRGGGLKVSVVVGDVGDCCGRVSQAPCNTKSNMADYLVCVYNNFGASDIFQCFIWDVF